MFNNEATRPRVAQATLERAEFTGSIRGYERHGLFVADAIGYRISPDDGSSTPLFYGEVKIDAENRYHVLPRINPAQSDWNFVEVWIDPMLFPPYILLLLSDQSGNCSVYDPVEGYNVVFSSASYDEAQTWLLEDEYEPIEGRFAASVL